MRTFPVESESSILQVKYKYVKVRNKIREVVVREVKKTRDQKKKFKPEKLTSMWINAVEGKKRNGYSN